MFEVKFFESENRVEIYNLSEYPYEINAPVKLKVEPKEYNKSFIDLGLNVLRPIDNGEDFVFVYSSTSVGKNVLYSFDNVIGRSFGDLHPYFKEYFYPVFKKVLNTGERGDVSFYIFEDGELRNGLELKVVLHEDELFFFMENKTELYKRELREKYQFDLSSFPKTIFQDGKILKVNKAFEKLINVPNSRLEGIPVERINYWNIIYNDTGLVLNYSQLLDKILSGEYYQITFDLLFKEENELIRYQNLARYININDKPAVEIITLRKLENYDIEANVFSHGKFDLIQKIAKTAFISYDIENKEINWSRSLEDIVEDSLKNIESIPSLIDKIVPNKSWVKIEKLREKMYKSEDSVADEIKIITLKNNTKYLHYTLKPLYKDGKIVKRLHIVHDITEDYLNRQEIIKADAEKTVLVKEVHHRIKNNLQTITSLISLEERFETDSDEIIDITKSRINSLALIHESIYNEANMNYISIQQFFNSFDDKLKSLATHPDIIFTNEIEDLVLNVDYVTPMVLMINELTTNTFKYAFEKEDQNKEIYKSIKAYENKGVKICKFHYKDNGKGLPDDFDIDSSRSLGWTIIKSLVTQLEGEYKIFNDNGFNFILEFPIIK